MSVLQYCKMIIIKKKTMSLRTGAPRTTDKHRTASNAKSIKEHLLFCGFVADYWPVLTGDRDFAACFGLVGDCAACHLNAAQNTFSAAVRLRKDEKAIDANTSIAIACLTSLEPEPSKQQRKEKLRGGWKCHPS